GGDSGAGAAASRPGGGYPAPRWPSYFKPPKSVDDLMPAARALVRNTSGFQGKGMGILQPGDAVLIVPTANADPMVLEAITRALRERKITPHVRFTYEFLGLTREEVERREREERAGRDIEHAGIYQATAWITGQFPDPEVPKAWLKQRRPDLYAALFPNEAAGRGAGRQRADVDPETGLPRGSNASDRAVIGRGIQAYLKAHPDVRGVFWGSGGTTGLRRALYPMQDKYLGTFITDNIYQLQSQMTTYPGDVWQLAEEQVLEPLVYTERIEITDPEGTNLWADITPEMAERWSQGAYQRGHLYMFPNQATGRFGYSFVNYPGFQQKWLPREPIALINGVLAGTQGHGGFFPRWEIVFKNGFIADVRGGGAQGEALKEFLQYPGLNDRVFPYHTRPGFWYLYEIAFGSHPKAFRHPIPLLESGNTSPERARSGVIHWGLGIRLWHDPDAPTESKVWAEFTKKYNVPFDHGWHTHTYFTTYRVRLRGANKWVNLLDKGRMTSLDDPEVRALASRYGDPEYLLAEDWIPEVPGINAPGDYLKDYAPRPGTYSLQVLKRAMNGTYDHYFPSRGVVTTEGPRMAPDRVRGAK
ncbi:MAG TPA: hypothetical protein VNI83_08080, partial [Vicinamibacterales bacterium]|nr:hypothetical protein [Vicinamibacterales bacterium]